MQIITLVIPIMPLQVLYILTLEQWQITMVPLDISLALSEADL